MYRRSTGCRDVGWYTITWWDCIRVSSQPSRSLVNHFHRMLDAWGHGRRDGSDSLPVVPLILVLDGVRGLTTVWVHSQRDGRDSLPVALWIPCRKDPVIWGGGGDVVTWPRQVIESKLLNRGHSNWFEWPRFERRAINSNDGLSFWMTVCRFKQLSVVLKDGRLFRMTGSRFQWRAIVTDDRQSFWMTGACFE